MNKQESLIAGSLYVWAAIGKPRPDDNALAFFNWFRDMDRANKVFDCGRDIMEAFGDELKVAVRECKKWGIEIPKDFAEITPPSPGEKP